MSTNQQWHKINIVPQQLNFTDSVETHFKSGNTLEDALESYRQAIVLKSPTFFYKLLEKENIVRQKDISITTISLLKFDPIIKGAVEKLSTGKLS